MPLRISNLRLGLDEPEAALPEFIAKALGVPLADLGPWRILRKSLDARVKNSFHFVYTAEVTPLDEADFLKRAAKTRRSDVRVEPYREPTFALPPPGNKPLAHRPVIVGSGPAGLVAGFFLAQQGYRPIVLERGPAVRQRIHDVQRFDAGGPFNPESNYLFGEGGAGTFSDGKLTCRSSGPEVRRVLELFAQCKGKPSILYDYRPHLGSNRLPAVVKAIRRRIEAMGGEIRFNCRVEDLDLTGDGQIRGLATSSGHVPAQVVLLAIGHSARDTLSMLVRRGVPIVPKPFQMGVRIEQPQENVNRFNYGSAEVKEKLGSADYNLVARGRHDLFTFCMCAGGHVIPSVSEDGYFCTNGMSLSKRDSPFANSGLVVTVPVDEFPGVDVLAGVRLQATYERRAYELGRGEYICPIQWADDFLAGRPSTSLPPSSYSRGLVKAEIAELAPPLILEALRHGLPILDRRWHGKFLADATLVGPESRGSSPIRMVRDQITRESPGIDGLYPVGEGAGYAGGIVSAAVDGLRSAAAIIRKWVVASG
ncbi:MAG: FAD-dependent oxidoreductase [Planctomycetes bacterium]|nr:FAD-dependent oxidoreductase [Planctomycetota bacterium]